MACMAGWRELRKRDGPSDRATDHSNMETQHWTVVRHPVGQSIVLIAKQPRCLEGGGAGGGGRSEVSSSVKSLEEKKTQNKCMFRLGDDDIESPYKTFLDTFDFFV